MYDLTIVGASFSGLTLGIRASVLGLRVLIIEKKEKVSDNLSSTGILTSEAFELLRPPLNAVNLIKKVNLFSPKMKKITIEPDNYYRFYTTNLGTVLEDLYKKAKSIGVEFKMGQEFYKDLIKDTKFLVGADGANSAVARAFSLSTNTDFLVGHEIHVKKVTDFEKNAFNCYFSNKYAKGYMGWVAPYQDVLQIGVASLKKHKIDINGFIKHIGIETGEIVEKRSGIIPINGVVKNYSTDNVLLLGDAMGLVSPLSGGGIHIASLFGFIIGDLIAGYLKDNKEHPAKILPYLLPKWRAKKFLRLGMNICPDFAFDFGFSLPFFPRLAKKMFFH